VAARQSGSGDGVQDLLGQYLAELGRHPLLDRKGEIRLAQIMEDGTRARDALRASPDLDPAERDRLEALVELGANAQATFIQANLRLVVSLAKRYQSSGVPILDLIQEGNLGLMHAVEKFDWRKGFKFSTYATWWIRQAITRGMANTARTIRLPIHATEQLVKLRRAAANLESRLERPATPAELAEVMGTSADAVAMVLRHAMDPISLDSPLSAGGETTIADVLADQVADNPLEAVTAAMLPAEVAKLLSTLNSRDREVIAMRYGIGTGDPLTLDEIARHLGVSRERVRQMEARAMTLLRRPCNAVPDTRELLAG
jgi:RNA polymerase sigma factor (sigma-70 family)